MLYITEKPGLLLAAVQVMIQSIPRFNLILWQTKVAKTKEVEMKKSGYQVSLEGHVERRHAQLNFHDVDTYDEAMHEVVRRTHLPHDDDEEWIALLFSDRQKAVADGVPDEEIEDINGKGNLFRWKAWELKSD